MSALQLFFAVLLVLANGFFVGAEFALVSVRRSQIEPLDTKRARQVLYGLEHLPQMMAAAQFGITVCSLTLGAVAEPTVAHLLEPLFEAMHLPEGMIHPLGYVIALAAVVSLHLVIGEMIPKNLAMAAPEKTALWFSPGLVAFARLSPAGHRRPRRLCPARAEAVRGRAEGRGRGGLHQRAARPASSRTPDRRGCSNPRRRNAWRTPWSWARARSPTSCSTGRPWSRSAPRSPPARSSS